MLRNILPAVLIAAIAACHDPVSPDALRGTYALESIRNASLPLEYSTGIDGTYSLVADTIGLDGRGEAIRHTIIHRTASIFGPDTTFRVRRVAEYRVNGNHIEIGSFTPCPPNALCAANEVGYVTDTGIRLTFWQTGRDREGDFRRISDAVAP